MEEGTTGTNPTLSAKHTFIVMARAYLDERNLRAIPYRTQAPTCDKVPGYVRGEGEERPGAAQRSDWKVQFHGTRLGSAVDGPVVQTTRVADATALTEGCGGRSADYLSTLAPDRVSRLVKSIYETWETLVSFPHPRRPGTKAGTRELLLSPSPWIVIYMVRNDIIHVVRILAGAQRWP